MDFEKVAICFERIEQVTSRLEITALLADLFRAATPEEASIVCNFSLGQLNPSYCGTQFNLALKNVMKAVAIVLDMPLTDIEHEVKKKGDIGLVMVEMGDKKQHAHTYAHYQKYLTVHQVYNALYAIEQSSGVGSQEEKINQLVALLKQLTPIAAKYVLRIILDTLRLGFSDMTLLDALSWMYAGDKSLSKTIERAYTICADLGLIAEILKKEGIEAIQHMEIHTGIPIRPAAAERLPTAQAIMDKVGVAVAEPKIDGFRLQIHVDKTQSKPVISFFSRNLKDMSYMFPDLAPALLDLPVETMIVEGEVICFDQNTGSFLPFQETVRRKRKHGIEQAIAEFPLKLFLFDLLYLDGHSLLKHTQQSRRHMLRHLFVGYTHKYSHTMVQVIDEITVNTSIELENYFLKNIAAGLEGVMVKRPDALYQAGKRNFNWIKLKRQEAGHLEDTMDCVILGYYGGAGKRAKFGIGAFLVGVFNPERDMFQTIAKIGTGLKDAGWRELKTRCDAAATETKPRNIQCAKELIPDVWVWPELVCIVLADEITLSPVHTAGKTEHHLGYALRFPRILGYRDDKSAKETTTTHEIKRFYEDQFVS